VVNRGEEMAKEKHHQLLGAFTYLIMDVPLLTRSSQSFEQGWRKIPVHIERQLLFLVAMKRARDREQVPCWVIERCPMETRQRCPAWEFQSGHLCWFINGTICHGEAQASWREKMETCRKCEVFRSIVPSL